MGMTQATKQKLVFEIEHLSYPYIMELQNFVQYLKFKQSTKPIQSSNRYRLAPEQDPILSAIGIVDVTPFSNTIDDILYGAV